MPLDAAYSGRFARSDSEAPHCLPRSVHRPNATQLFENETRPRPLETSSITSASGSSITTGEHAASDGQNSSWPNSKTDKRVPYEPRAWVFPIEHRGDAGDLAIDATEADTTVLAFGRSTAPQRHYNAAGATANAHGLTAQRTCVYNGGVEFGIASTEPVRRSPRAVRERETGREESESALPFMCQSSTRRWPLHQRSKRRGRSSNHARKSKRCISCVQHAGLDSFQPIQLTDVEYRARTESSWERYRTRSLPSVALVDKHSDRYNHKDYRR